MGLGVDPVAERMAKFISGGPVDLSVVTFHGFLRGEEKLLARQLEVDTERPEPAHPHRSPPSRKGAKPCVSISRAAAMRPSSTASATTFANFSPIEV